MWKVAGVIALSIFLTCTLFFVIYGMSYLIVMKTIEAVKRIKQKSSDLNHDNT